MVAINSDLPNIENVVYYEAEICKGPLHTPVEFLIPFELPKGFKWTVKAFELDKYSHEYADFYTNNDIFTIRSKYIYTILLEELGLKDYQAIAFLCVLYAESALNSNIGKSWGGHGIAQWTQSRKTNFHKFAVEEVGLQKAQTIKKYPFTAHVSFLVLEMTTGYKKILKRLQNSKSFEEAVDLILRGYENGSGSSLASKDTLDRIYNTKKQGYLTYQKMYRDRLNNKKYFKFLKHEL